MLIDFFKERVVVRVCLRNKPGCSERKKEKLKEMQESRKKFCPPGESRSTLKMVHFHAPIRPYDFAIMTPHRWKTGLTPFRLAAYAELSIVYFDEHRLRRLRGRLLECCQLTLENLQSWRRLGRLAARGRLLNAGKEDCILLCFNTTTYLLCPFPLLIKCLYKNMCKLAIFMAVSFSSQHPALSVFSETLGRIGGGTALKERRCVPPLSRPDQKFPQAQQLVRHSDALTRLQMQRWVCVRVLTS